MVTNNGQPDGRALRLECAGLTVGDFSVPPCTVLSGQAVCLHVPPVQAPGREQLLALLAKRAAHPALRFFGSVRYLTRPMPRRRWWGGLYNPPVRDWLIYENDLAPQETANILERLALSPHLRIGRAGWNERTMLALEACLLRPPDLLIFDTAGNDPLATQQVFERIVTRPRPLAVVYLKLQSNQDELCLPGAACLAVTCHALQVAAVE